MKKFFGCFFSRQLNANSFLKVASLHPGGGFSSWQEAASPGPAFRRRRFVQPLIPPVRVFFFFFSLAAEFGIFLGWRATRSEAETTRRTCGGSRALKVDERRAGFKSSRQSGKVSRLELTGTERRWRRVGRRKRRWRRVRRRKRRRWWRKMKMRSFGQTDEDQSFLLQSIYKTKIK